MKVVSVLGRLPVLKDTLQLPVLRSDGKVTYMTPREVLELEEKTSLRNRLYCEGTNEPGTSFLSQALNLLEDFFTKLRKLFS